MLSKIFITIVLGIPGRSPLLVNTASWGFWDMYSNYNKGTHSPSQFEPAKSWIFLIICSSNLEFWQQKNIPQQKSKD